MYLLKKLNLTSSGNGITYHNITEDVKKTVEESSVNNGFCVVQTAHTTCSVIFEEFVHDTDFRGLEFLQVDLNAVLDKIIPREMSEDTIYRYPGPKHLDFLNEINDSNYPNDPATILNGDAHLKSTFLGASETFIINDGVLNIGKVGSIYFIDFDQNRERDRICSVMVYGE